MLLNLSIIVFVISSVFVNFIQYKTNMLLNERLDIHFEYIEMIEKELQQLKKRVPKDIRGVEK
jgi:hypothetical protein